MFDTPSEMTVVVSFTTANCPGLNCHMLLAQSEPLSSEGDLFGLATRPFEFIEGEKICLDFGPWMKRVRIYYLRRCSHHQCLRC